MSTTIDDNKAWAERFGHAINRRRYDLLDDILAPGFVRHCQATPELQVNSLQQFKEYLRQDNAVCPDSVQKLHQMVAEGDLVALWLTYEGTQQGAMGPFPATGRKLQLECAVFLRIDAGKIAEMWVTWDNMAALAQLGHLTGK